MVEKGGLSIKDVIIDLLELIDDTDGGDLLKQIERIKAACVDACQQFAVDWKRIDFPVLPVDDEGEPGGGQFEWINSPLVDAIINGDWIVLENVNFCRFACLH